MRKKEPAIADKRIQSDPRPGKAGETVKKKRPAPDSPDGAVRRRRPSSDAPGQKKSAERARAPRRRRRRRRKISPVTAAVLIILLVLLMAGSGAVGYGISCWSWARTGTTVWPSRRISRWTTI